MVYSWCNVTYPPEARRTAACQSAVCKPVDLSPSDDNLDALRKAQTHFAEIWFITWFVLHCIPSVCVQVDGYLVMFGPFVLSTCSTHAETPILTLWGIAWLVSPVPATPAKEVFPNYWPKFTLLTIWIQRSSAYFEPKEYGAIIWKSIIHICFSYS